MNNNSEVVVLVGSNQVRVAVSDSFNLIVKNHDVKQTFLKAIARVVSSYVNEDVKSIVIEFGASKNSIEFDPIHASAIVRLSNNVAEELAKATIQKEHFNYPPEIRQELIERLSDMFQKEMSKLVIVNEKPKDKKLETIIVNDTSRDYIPTLTPEYVATTIVSYINAIIDLQHFIERINGQEPSNIKITEIKRNSPISVSLDGASEAIQIIKETIVPWRRKHAEMMAQLIEQEKLIEIEAKKAEVLEKRAIAAKEREQTDKIKLENQKLRLELELNQAKVQLGLEILSAISKNLDEYEKEIYIRELLPIIEILAAGKIDLLDKQKAG